MLLRSPHVQFCICFGPCRFCCIPSLLQPCPAEFLLRPLSFLLRCCWDPVATLLSSCSNPAAFLLGSCCIPGADRCFGCCACCILLRPAWFLLRSPYASAAAPVVFAAFLLGSCCAPPAFRLRPRSFLLRSCCNPADFLLRSCCAPCQFVLQPCLVPVALPLRICCGPSRFCCVLPNSCWVPAALPLGICCSPSRIRAAFLLWPPSFLFWCSCIAVLLVPSAFLMEFRLPSSCNVPVVTPLHLFCAHACFYAIPAASLLRSCYGAVVLLPISSASLLLFLLRGYAQPEPLIRCFF